MRRLTQADWDAVAAALAFAAAGEWDSDEERPDFEVALDKVNERRKEEK